MLLEVSKVSVKPWAGHEVAGKLQRYGPARIVSKTMGVDELEQFVVPVSNYQCEKNYA